MGSVDLHKIKKDWHTRGYSFGVWTDSPGQQWKDFVYEVDELFIVVNGPVELEMMGKKWCPDPGEEVLIPAQVTHSVRNIGQTGSRWLYGYKNR